MDNIISNNALTTKQKVRYINKFIKRNIGFIKLFESEILQLEKVKKEIEAQTKPNKNVKLIEFGNFNVDEIEENETKPDTPHIMTIKHDKSVKLIIDFNTTHIIEL